MGFVSLIGEALKVLWRGLVLLSQDGWLTPFSDLSHVEELHSFAC